MLQAKDLVGIADSDQPTVRTRTRKGAGHRLGLSASGRGLASTNTGENSIP